MCQTTFWEKYIQRTVSYLNLFTNFNLLSCITRNRSFVRVNQLSSTYFLSQFSVLKTHANSMNYVGFEMSGEDKNLPYLYWTPKLHKTPFKHRFIAGSSIKKCTTKDLSCLLTKVLSTVKDGLIYKGTKPLKPTAM